MRVGLVSAEYPPSVGGVGDHTARLAHELSHAGHDIDVLTTATNVSLSAANDPSPHELRFIPRWDWRILRHIPRIAHDRHWDVLHIQYQPAAYGLHGAINLLPWLVRGPAVVTTFHDLRVPYLFPKAGPLRRAAVAALARGSDAAICVADSDLDQLRRWRAGLAPDTTRHVPLGDQLDAAPPDDFSPAAWRTRLGVQSHTPLVAHFGLINQSKGALELVRALAALPHVHLVFIGESLGASDPTNAAYLDEVRAEINRLSLAQRVHWTGYVTPAALGGWLATVDVVALPFLDGASLRRTSLVTAWRRGAPVVTTEPAARAAWRADPPGSRAARYVPPGDVTALATALRDVLESASLRETLTQHGRHFADRFSWSSVVEQTLAVYDAALSARRA